MDSNSDHWLTRVELAGRLKLPPKTLAEWASKGAGPRFAKIGRFCRYKLSDVIDWEEAQFKDDPKSAA
ncbi:MULTISPECIES: helix-turn-helix domain-containing protein [Actinomycetes]|uniref:helix-turn-helix transcriptional regulator n=1 Tax=Actinomycetes TaxID=1760 RepID=UPI0004C0236F|nr:MULTISPECIES: helix-turn-helix domain-containing protein [Actinomycetes]